MTTDEEIDLLVDTLSHAVSQLRSAA